MSFEDIANRGKCARKISELLEKNSLNWCASPSVKKSEIFVRPKGDYEWDNFQNISRMSLQIKDGKISFGISGYFPYNVRDTKKVLENRNYEYHDKGYTIDGRPKGRWWLTKSIESFEEIVGELRDIEHIILKK